MHWGRFLSRVIENPLQSRDEGGRPSSWTSGVEPDTTPSWTRRYTDRLHLAWRVQLATASIYPQWPKVLVEEGPPGPPSGALPMLAGQPSRRAHLQEGRATKREGHNQKLVAHPSCIIERTSSIAAWSSRYHPLLIKTAQRKAPPCLETSPIFRFRWNRFAGNSKARRA